MNDETGSGADGQGPGGGGAVFAGGVGGGFFVRGRPDCADGGRRGGADAPSAGECPGLGFANVVKTTVFLTDLNQFAVMNEVYARYFPSAPPARSTVEVARLPKDALVEIEVVAAR
jgi:hypothetical protein